MTDLILGAVVAPVFVAPVTKAVLSSYRYLVGAETFCAAAKRWHRAFTWPQRIGILCLVMGGLGHLWLVVR